MHLASKGKLPLTENELACAWTQNRFQGGPMAIGSPEHYVLVMEILFDCLWPIWGEYKEEIMQLNGYDRRAMAFMSERLLSGIVLFSEKFFGNIPLRFIPLQYYGP
jgi:hypothetical protein